MTWFQQALQEILIYAEFWELLLYTSITVIFLKQVSHYVHVHPLKILQHFLFHLQNTIQTHFHIKTVMFFSSTLISHQHSMPATLKWIYFPLLPMHMLFLIIGKRFQTQNISNYSSSFPQLASSPFSFPSVIPTMFTPIRNILDFSSSISLNTLTCTSTTLLF